MTWLRIDDGFVEHPKIVELSDRAFRLHMAALCYSARNLTDGVLVERCVRVLFAITNAQKKHLRELVFAGVWSEGEHEGTFVICDYLDYNPSAETVKKRRDEAKGRMAALRGSQERSHEQTVNEPANVRTPRPVPSPTRPKKQDQDLTHSARRNSMKVDGKIASEEEQAKAALILQAFNDVFGTKFAARESVAKIIMRCREHPDLTVDEHRAAIQRSFDAPWWTDAPGPAVVYGNAALFEKALSAVGTPVNGNGFKPGRYGTGMTAAQVAALTEDQLDEMMA